MKKFKNIGYLLLILGMFILTPNIYALDDENNVSTFSISSTYNIEYQLNGGINNESNITYINSNDSVFTLLEPTNQGFVFLGWYIDSDFINKITEINPNELNGDVVLYAEWGKETFNISYELNGGINNKNNPTMYVYNTNKITLNNPERLGYTFDGWYKDSNFSERIEFIDENTLRDLTLYAKWIPNKYTIKFDGNGATSGNINSISAVYDNSYSLTNSFLKTGYSFNSFNTKKDGSGTKYSNNIKVKNLVTKNNGNITLYAIWDKTKYSITYNLNGGVNNKNNPSTYYIDTNTISLLNPKRKGYTFKGWFSDKKYKNSISEIKKGTSKNTVLYAKWSKNKYTIKFDGNNATSGSMDNVVLKYDNLYTLKNGFKRKGYTFVGFNTKKDGSGTTYKNKTSIKNLVSKNNGSITLYATWKKTKYTVTYNLNGGKNNKNNPTSYKISTKTINLLNPTKKGYTFKGWYLDKNYKTKVTQIKKGTSKNTVLYAKWAKKKYKINYNLNGGVNNKNNPSTYKITSKVTFSNPERKGYTFKGWFADSNYKTSIKEIAKGSTGTKNVYAKWSVNKYTIKFDGNGATSGKVSDMTSLKYNKKYTLNKNKFKKTGYEFKGWNTKKDGSGKTYKNSASIKNLTSKNNKTVTLYAIWGKTEEASVYDAMIALKKDYPEGMKWTNDDFYAWTGGYYYGGYGCAGFAFILSDAAFYGKETTMHTDFDNIRVGDILRIYNDSHSVIVLEVKEDSVIVAEGNYNSSIHWGREISLDVIKNTGTYVMTRY